MRFADLRWGGVAVLMVATLLCAVLAFDHADAEPTPTFGSTTGFASPTLTYESPADMNADLDAQAAAGASWVRFDLAWSVAESVRGSYAWSRVDAAVDAADLRGIKVLLVLAYAPTWASGCSTDKCLPTEANVPAYAAFAGTAAAHFRGRVAAYEVWNEPNQRWAAGTPDPARYTALAKAAYPAIKANDASATVLVGAAAPSATADGDYSPLDWAKALWADGIGGSFDAWSAHPYTYPALPAAAGTEGWSAWWAMEDIHDLLVAVGRPVPVWMTEFGTPTRGEGYADTFQRDAIVAAITTAASLPWAGPLFLYTVRDTATDGGYVDSFGLLNRDWTPKPAWQPVSDLLHQKRPPSSETTTTTTTTVAPPTTSTPQATTTTTIAPTTTTTPAPPTTAPPDAPVDPSVLLLSEQVVAYEQQAAGVIRAYNGILGRPPEQAGLTAWTDAIARGAMTLASMEDATAWSPEFIAKYGVLSDEAFIDQVYRNALGREPSSAAVLVARLLLDAGLSRGAIAEVIVGMITTRAAAQDMVEAVSSYEVVVGTAPDERQIEAWPALGGSLADRLARFAGLPVI